MLTVLTGLLASLSYASSDMFSQRVTRETRPLTQMVWVLVTGVVVILPVALLIRGLPHAGEWQGAGLAGADDGNVGVGLVAEVIGRGAE